MALKSDADSIPKRRNVDEEGDQGRPEMEAVAAVDRISALPNELRLRILSDLPLASAISTDALSKAWRGLWRHRFPAPSSLHLRVSRRDTTQVQLLEPLQRRGARRLDHLSLTFFGHGRLTPMDFALCSLGLNYAADCATEDLLVNFVDHDPSRHRYTVFDLAFSFRFSPASPLLARAALRGITVGLPHAPDGANRFSSLEVIHLHSAILEGSIHDLVAASPRLHTLDLRDCRGRSLRVVDVRPAGARLRRLTISRCSVGELIVADTPSGSCLRSFRFSGEGCPDQSFIPANAPLNDLCLCFGARLNFFTHLRLRSKWLEALANFSRLTVLTICSYSLPIARTFLETESLDQHMVRQNLEICFGKETELELAEREREMGTLSSGSILNLYLQSLRELQLLLFVMDGAILSDIYEFFRICQCPKLERLFVQFPKSHDHLATIEVDAPFEELSGEDVRRKSPQEEASVEELPHEEPLKKVPVSVDELSKQDASGGGLPEEDAPMDGLSEENLLEAGLENLVLVKMVNFNGDQNEMEFVSSLLRKATSLTKLLLVSPKKGKLGELQEDQLYCAEKILLQLRKASANVQVILRESDDAGIQPVHSKVIES